MNEDDILYTEQSDSVGDVVSEPVEDNSSDEVENPGNESILEDELVNQEEDASLVPMEVIEVVDLPEYTVDNPLPVVLVETEEEEAAAEVLEVYSLTGKYYGTISDTYLDYFEGIVQKLQPNDHYVIWRSGQYAYTMAYGEDITLEGSYFSGDCECVYIYRSSDSYSSDWYVEYSSDSLALSAGDLFVYSDLGMYPIVERGLSHDEGMAVLVSFAVLTVFILASRIFDCIVKFVYRK